MPSVNKVILVARLGKDPEKRVTNSGKSVTTLNVATSDKWTDQSGQKQEKTEWHRVIFWGNLADLAEQYLKKGSLVYVEGTLQTKEWQDKDGNKRYTTEISGQSMQFLDSKPQGQGQQQGNCQQRQHSQPPGQQGGDFIPDDVPF